MRQRIIIYWLVPTVLFRMKLGNLLIKPCLVPTDIRKRFFSIKTYCEIFRIEARQLAKNRDSYRLERNDPTFLYLCTFSRKADFSGI